MLNPDNSNTASWLWQRAKNIKNTIAETYLRQARCYGGPIPETFRFLPANGKYKPALVCPYGREIADDTVPRIHLIKLNGDGSDRFRPAKGEPEPAKQTLGTCPGEPIVCVSFDDARDNDALVIGEGVEDVLSACEAMNFSGWAAGGATRMPALAETVPDHVSYVYILVDDNAAGNKESLKLASILTLLGREVFTVLLEGTDANQFRKDHGLDALREEIERKKKRYQPPPPSNLKLTDLSEQGVMREFIARNKDHLRYHNQRNQWLIWHGHYWKLDQRQVAFCDALDLCHAVEAKSAQKVHFAAQVEKAARAKLAVAAEDLDRDPLLLGTPDGVVDFRNGGKLRNGRPDDMISKVTLVAPSDNAECPVFDGFIRFALNNDATNIAFLDRYLGYGLTGLTREEFLLYLLGMQGSGKGTLTKTLMNILHDYSRAVPIEMFTDKSTKQEYYRADLNGYRLIVAAEPEKGSAWNEAFVNEATGGDIMSGRHPGGRPFHFDPTHKLMIHGNTVPELKTAASGIKRRLGILPFDHVPDKPDTTLKEALRAEYPAILRRMINGCLEYLKNGLMVPDTVKAATSEYFNRQDRLPRFIGDMVDSGKYRKIDTKRVRSGPLMKDYNQWADQNGERRVNANGFHDMVKNSADPAIRPATGRGNTSWVHGLELTAEPSLSEG